MPTTSTSHTFRAFKHRNYRLFFSGQLVSMTGTWLTRVASAWLVYSLSHSALVLGLVSFAGQLPTFLLAPFGGVLVDRWNRHTVLVVTQILSMIQSLLLAVLTLTGNITIPHILVLSIMQGLINAFDTPARQSFVVEMVEDRADLSNAIALNSSLVNLARLLGPSLAGILIASIGVGGCFVIDTVSYAGVILSLLLMRLKKREKPIKSDQKPMLAELRAGFSYVCNFAPIRALLLLLAMLSFVGMPYTVLMPIIAGERLGGGAQTLGYLSGAVGLGALAGALYLASRKSVLGLGRVLIGACFLFGAGLIGLGMASWLPLAMLACVLTGFGMITTLASTNTLLQTITDEDKRGRVMSYYTMAFFGMAPFGSLFAGLMGHIVSAQSVLVMGGVSCIIGGLLFMRISPRLRDEVRPIYARLGIIPEVAKGVEAASNATTPPEN